MNYFQQIPHRTSSEHCFRLGNFVTSYHSFVTVQYWSSVLIVTFVADHFEILILPIRTCLYLRIN